VWANVRFLNVAWSAQKDCLPTWAGIAKPIRGSAALHALAKQAQASNNYNVESYHCSEWKKWNHKLQGKCAAQGARAWRNPSALPGKHTWMAKGCANLQHNNR
jgi:hypothetical protein